MMCDEKVCHCNRSIGTHWISARQHVVEVESSWMMDLQIELHRAAGACTDAGSGAVVAGAHAAAAAADDDENGSYMYKVEFCSCGALSVL